MTRPLNIPAVINPLQQPYASRQLIVVAEDAIVNASRDAALKELQSKNSVDWAKIAVLVLRASLGPTGTLITSVAKEAYEAWSRARNTGLDVVAISKTEATILIFPPGHPRDGVLYIGHPAIHNVYYTIAEFHRVTFAHKFSEAINILLHLGATEINVEHIHGWSRDFSANISVPIPSADASVGAQAGAKSAQKDSILFKASLDGTDTPTLPPKLVWYPHEPTWEMIANARMQFGLREFALSVTYNDDFGINAGLKATASRAGLDLGGKFEDHVSTEWRISGKFRESKKSPNLLPPPE
jgi:hypothetical protein